MVKLVANTGKLSTVWLDSVWIKHGHFAGAKPCGKTMDKSRRLDIAHRFPTLDNPLTTLHQSKFMRKFLTKNSTTTNIYRVDFSSKNHPKTAWKIVLFFPVCCPTIGGRFNTTNAIESVNSVIRKSTKPIHNWKPAMNRFMIEFEERLQDHV